MAARKNVEDMNNLFRPPNVHYTIGVLNRSLFNKTVKLAAAAVANKQKIAEWRKKLEKERTLLSVERLAAVVPHPDQAQASQGARCLLLDPKVQAEVPDTWSAALRDGVNNSELRILPYDMALDYSYWTYDDVMKCLLPPDQRDDQDGIPSGFNLAGHIAHLNLREEYLPYKKLIAEVLLDKNPGVRTVINKVAGVGTESEFRTFAYEVLAGDDDLNVIARENECVYRFDYGKVYWNSKLEGEHRRMVELFKPGEVVCDVMAGIGPFAVPAGKRGVIVWANDYNPESYKALLTNVERNKVEQFVRGFNHDGRIFIAKAARQVLEANAKGKYVVKHVKLPKTKSGHQKIEHVQVPIPPTISHFVMNLPASAITFLRHFMGIYVGKEKLFEPHTETKLPMVHVYCFAARGEGDAPLQEVCEMVSHELKVEMKLGDPEIPRHVEVLEIRAVAPNKRMFCASFRIPPEIAFAPPFTRNMEPGSSSDAEVDV